MNDIIKRAQEVFDIEIEGIQQVKNNLGSSFEKMVKLCSEKLNNGGKLVLSGVGKSGHIGKKLAATLASTGSTAVFMHPVEALHGDLGLLCNKDLFIALSYSGETDELVTILPAVKRLQVPIVAITASTKSSLSEWSDLTVEMPVEKEACPFNLAPTTTAIALLALGDALAIVLMEKHQFSKQDYGKYHPGGAIGRAITLKVSDIMRSEDKIALIKSEISVKDAIFAMTKAKCGSAIIIDENKKLLGIFTDGDFRRNINKSLDVLNKPISDVMTINPTYVYAEKLAIDVLNIVENKNIDDIIVVNKNEQVVGMIDIQDLPKLKLM